MSKIHLTETERDTLDSILRSYANERSECDLASIIVRYDVSFIYTSVAKLLAACGEAQQAKPRIVQLRDSEAGLPIVNGIEEQDWYMLLLDNQYGPFDTEYDAWMYAEQLGYPRG